MDHPEHPHHTGIPHWVDNVETTQLLIARSKQGWIQPGWAYSNPNTVTYTSEIYGIPDMDMGADEQDLDKSYQKVNVAEDYNWDKTSKYQ